MHCNHISDYTETQCITNNNGIGKLQFGIFDGEGIFVENIIKRIIYRHYILHAFSAKTFYLKFILNNELNNELKISGIMPPPPLVCKGLSLEITYLSA